MRSIESRQPSVTLSLLSGFLPAVGITRRLRAEAVGAPALRCVGPAEHPCHSRAHLGADPEKRPGPCSPPTAGGQLGKPAPKFCPNSPARSGRDGSWCSRARGLTPDPRPVDSVLQPPALVPLQIGSTGPAGVWRGLRGCGCTLLPRCLLAARRSPGSHARRRPRAELRRGLGPSAVRSEPVPGTQDRCRALCRGRRTGAGPGRAERARRSGPELLCGDVIDSGNVSNRRGREKGGGRQRGRESKGPKLDLYGTFFAKIKGK